MQTQRKPPFFSSSTFAACTLYHSVSCFEIFVNLRFLFPSFFPRWRRGVSRHNILILSSFPSHLLRPPFSFAPIGRVVTRFPHFPLLQPGRAGNLRVVDVTRFASKFRVSTYNFAARRVFRRITRTCGLRRGSPTAKATRTFRGSTNGT